MSRLFCQACPRVSGDEAKGWRVYRVDEPGLDEEPKLAAYCPACAERKFGAIGKAAD